MENLKQQLRVYWNIRWLRRSSISAVAIALILLSIPLAIQYSLIHLLKKQGASDAQIQDINLNLFAGTFELRQLTVTTAGHEPSQIALLSTDIDMLDLFTRRLVVSDLLIDGVKLNIQRADDGGIAINGLKIPLDNTSGGQTGPSEKPTASPIEFGINKLSITHAAINYQEAGFSQNSIIHALTLTELKSWDKSSAVHLALDLNSNDAPLTLSAELNLFSEVQRFKGSVSLDSLSLSPYAKFYRAYLDNLQGSISLETAFDVSLADSVSAKMSSHIQLNQLELDYQQLNQSVQTISWQGDAALSSDGEISLKGDLDIHNNQTKDTKQDYLISSFERLFIQDLEKTQQIIGFKQLDLQKMLLINTRQDGAFVELDQLTVLGMEFQPESSRLNIEQIGLKKPAISVAITRQKQLAQLTPLFNTLDRLAPSSQTAEAPQAKTPTEAKKPLAIEIGKIQLQQPGSLAFSDNSVSPNYKTRMTINQLEIDKLSSTNSAHFIVALKQGEYTSFDIDGDGLLFNPAANLQLNARIKQLDLPPVTPYTSQAMGYGMKSGVIDSDIAVKLNQREIDSLVKLKIDSIQVVETSKQTAEQVSSASGMSIDLAISTLKDSDNVIELKLPVKGNIDQPDFDLSLIINQAMGKAMKSASLAYLKHALQPFGSLITLYSLAKAAADHISLPPVLFVTNSLSFKQDQQGLLDKVIKVLHERPDLKIKACAVSSLEDQNAIRNSLIEAEIARLKKLNPKADKIAADTIVVDEELVQQRMRELADQRSARVKAVFLEQGKLEPSRILNCLSATRTDEKSQASVELLI